MIAIINYGLGNVGSLSSSLGFLGAESVVTAEPDVIRAADKLILPGVGAFGDAMNKLNALNLPPLLAEQAASGKPLLGICLGMQLLFEQGYEYGTHPGLGLIAGGMYPLADDLAGSGLKVPHMGWNSLNIAQTDCPLLKNSHEGDYVYFVHSYYGKDCAAATAATADYGVSIPATMWRGNVYGCQFHPEKSGAVGLNILRAFLEL